MNTIKVRDIEIGAGAPKIIVPIVVDGPTGTAAQFVTVSTAGGHVFSRANSSAAYAPTTIALTATPTGIGVPTYQW